MPATPSADDTRTTGVAHDEVTSRPASATRLSLSHITAQNETNLLGTVHGGVVMTLVDSVAGVVAARHSGGPAVTASMDEMVFLVPVRVGDVVHFTAQVNWTGRSSMEVGVRISADRWDCGRARRYTSRRRTWCSWQSTRRASRARYRRWCRRRTRITGGCVRRRSAAATGWPVARRSSPPAR